MDPFFTLVSFGYFIVALPLLIASYHVRLLFKIVTLIGLIFLTFAGYEVLRFYEISCIDAGVSCIERMRSSTNLIVSLFSTMPILCFILILINPRRNS